MVTAGQPVSISAVVAGIQSFLVTVNGGNVTVGSNTGNIGLPDFGVSVNGIAKIAHYARNSIGTAGSYCSAGACYTSTNQYAGIDVFYTAENTVSIVGLAAGGTSCPGGYPSFINATKTYQGMDSNSYISWASFSDQAQTTYSAVYSFLQKSNIGEATTLYCKAISTDPSPAGGSFASGAPSGLTSSGINDGTFVLVAQ